MAIAGACTTEEQNHYQIASRVGPAAVRPKAASLASADCAPLKVRADVLLTGHASAPGGSAPSMDVALRFGAEGNAFERQIRVFGDRHWQKKGATSRPSKPAPFDRMPISVTLAGAVRPGSAEFTKADTPRVVGGTTPEATEAISFYGQLVDKVFPVSSTRM